jgi:branched-chain amino acid transport system substrate-binding protein
MILKKLAIGALSVALAATAYTVSAQAEDTLFVPSLTYRTGPFGGGGTPFADGYADYFNMLNARDGGIGGIKVTVEECETGYNSQKGVECYDATKGKEALVYSPLSTGITLALIPKAAADGIPIFSMGYGLSAAAIGEKFPWVFNYPTTYWNQLTSILKYIGDKEGGLDKLKGKKIGFIYLDVGYGKEPLPVLDILAKEYGFEAAKFPVGVKEMQNQSSQWLNVRKARPDWMIMWGWGAMNATAVKEAAKIRFPLDRFIGNWWAGAHADMKSVGTTGKGYLAANLSGIGADFPALQDIIKHVVDAGNSKVKSKEDVGTVLYNRGLLNAVVIAEAIKAAQDKTGKKKISAADLREGFESFDLSQARWKELGLEGFTGPIKGDCKDHEGAGPIFIQQWDGTNWKKISDLIPPMAEKTRPLLEEAAEKYVSDKPDWKMNKCG